MKAGFTSFDSKDVGSSSGTPQVLGVPQACVWGLSRVVVLETGMHTVSMHIWWPHTQCGSPGLLRSALMVGTEDREPVRQR